MRRDERERLLDLFRSMQGDMVPSVVRAFDRDDLQLIHSAVLTMLDRPGDPPTLNELASGVGRSLSRMSRIVEQLVGRGLVERKGDPRDRRLRRVVLTDEGRDLVDRVRRMRLGAMTELVDELTEKEGRQVLDAMELLAKAAGRFGDARRG